MILGNYLKMSTTSALNEETDNLMLKSDDLGLERVEKSAVQRRNLDFIKRMISLEKLSDDHFR